MFFKIILSNIKTLLHFHALAILRALLIQKNNVFKKLLNEYNCD